MSVDCENCGNDLQIRAQENPPVDFVRTACEECGRVNQVSLVRLAEEQKPQ